MNDSFFGGERRFDLHCKSRAITRMMSWMLLVLKYWGYKKDSYD